MIYFLHGQDTYRSRQKLHEIIAAFREKAGGMLNVMRVDAEEQPDAVFDVGRTGSLFAEKELVVIERASGSRGEAQEYLESRVGDWAKSKTLTVIFWEGELKNGDGLAAILAKAAAKAQEFRPLPAVAVRRRIAAEAAVRKIRLAPREADILVARFGSDLWSLSNELWKIRDGWSVESAQAREENVWAFTDAFFKRPRSAFRALTRLLESGHEAMYLVGALASALRALTRVWWGARTGKLKKAGAGLHPFVVRKNAELARNLTLDSIARCYDRLVAADVEQKTGVLPPPLPLVKLVLQRRQSDAER